MFIVIFRTNRNSKSRIMQIFFNTLFFLFISISCFSQVKLTQLPPELKESSALLKHKNVFLTINDSDNAPIVFVFNNKGEITHTSFIKNVINWDWEALAYDGKEYLYIGDIGNNLNQRKDLTIYKVRMDDVLENDTIEDVTKILFSYPEQKAFPPDSSQLYYDAEALIFKDDSLFIFTKNRTVPYDGISKIYSLPIESGVYQAQFDGEFHLSSTNWLESSVTDANYYNNRLFLLTYSKAIVFEYKKGEWEKMKEYRHDTTTQKEGIAADDNYIYMTDEYQKIFGNNYLYQLRIKN